MLSGVCRRTRGVAVLRRLAGLVLALALLAGCAPERELARQPIVLIGVDGLEWRVVLGMLRAGRLPTIGRLMREGVFGKLASLSPTKSPVIWTSVATGKVPEKHGILHFVDERQETMRLYSNRDRRTKALWNVFSDFERTVHTIGWWVTFPAERIHGTMVAQTNTVGQLRKAGGAGVWKGTVIPGLPGQVTPEAYQPRVMEVAAEVVAALPELGRTVFGDLASASGTLAASHWQNTEWALRADAIYRRLAVEILGRPGEAFDLLLVYFGLPDVVGHRFWRYAFPDEFAHAPPPAELRHFGDVVADAYAFVDDAIAEILGRLPPDANVLIVSDHGMHPINTRKQFRADDRPRAALSAHHNNAPAGVIVARGPRIATPRGDAVELETLMKSDLKVLGGVLDVAPTILALAGLPVGADMDGRVMERVLDETFAAHHPPTAVDTHDSQAWLDARPGTLLPAEVEAERLEQLRGLGYVE
jgi:hypothetical protein